MKTIKALAVCCALLALPAGARAAAEAPAASSPPAGAIDTSAKVLVDTFAETCLAYIGREAQLKVWLDANMEVANDRQAPLFLGPLSGKVWFRKNVAGNYAIVVFDYGLCTVKAEHGPMDDALKYFEDTAAPKLKLALTRTEDDPNGTFEDIAGHVRTYSFQNEGNRYAIIVSGTQRKTTPLQSQFTLVLQTDPTTDADKPVGDGK